MPKIYKRNCDYCGIPYKGLGAKYCTHEHASLAAERKNETAPPTKPDESIRTEMQGDDIAVVSVHGSRRLKSAQEMIEATDLDPKEWIPVETSQKQYEGFMKDGHDKPVVVPLFYVSVRFERKKTAFFDLSPRVLKITRPSSQKAHRMAAATVHYSDIHFPYHDPRAINILLQILDYVDPYATFDHGDLMDCTEISKYEKNPTRRVSLQEEIDMAAKFNGLVHAICHADCQHTFFEGNHEDRIRKKIWEMADRRADGELIMLRDVQDALRLESLLGIDGLGWERVPYPEHRVLNNKIVLIHGNNVSSTSAASARKEYLRYGKSGISGHTHRRGVFEHRDYNGFHCWVEMGMLGAIRNDYVSYPDWQQGFLVTTWNADRTEFGHEPIRIHEGVAYFRGKRFVGDSTAFGALAA